jgi:hypothetical protein
MLGEPAGSLRVAHAQAQRCQLQQLPWQPLILPPPQVWQRWLLMVLRLWQQQPVPVTTGAGGCFQASSPFHNFEDLQLQLRQQRQCQ